MSLMMNDNEQVADAPTKQHGISHEVDMRGERLQRAISQPAVRFQRAISQPFLRKSAAPDGPTPKPAKVLQAVYKVGEFKAELPLEYLLVQSFLAGLYKSVGCLTFVVVGGGVLGAALFPVGLIAIILTSAELFTGDLLILVVSVLSQRVTWTSLWRNLVVSWVGNFAGTLVWAALIGYSSGVVEDNDRVEFIRNLAEFKTNQEWGNVLCKGIGANFLVCLAVWQAMTAQEVVSKVFAIWFPVVAFVTAGLEHVVANMFLIPLGMMHGADVTVGEFLWWNIIPSTIGNIIGGAFGIALPYWFLFDSTSKGLELMSHFNNHFNQRLNVKSTSSSFGDNDWDDDKEEEFQANKDDNDESEDGKH